MRVVELEAPGGPEAMRVGERPRPRLKAGEVLIQVEAAGVNRPDVLQRKGLYPPPPGASDVLGLEVAGIVVEGGDTGFKPGVRVCALVNGGGYAEYCAAPAAQCLPVPHGLNMSEAAGLPETYFTVWSNVWDRAHLSPAESLLVHGGSSGIGVAAVQLARALGHRVFATAGTPEKCRAVEALGAERCINYRSEDFVAAVLQLTERKGVDVILDMVGGDYIARDLACLAEDGRLSLIAVQGGKQATIDCALVLMRRLHIAGSTLRGRSVAFKAAIARNLLERVWPLFETGVIKPVVAQTFPLERVADAHRLMESSAHIGKIVLTL